MCQFINQLPAKSRMSASGKKRSLWLGIRPTGPGEYYKFRLLGFKSRITDRSDPFIERYVHQHWETDPETKKRSLADSVICPVTPHVHVDGNKYEACKICAYDRMNFAAWKESGWRDRESAKKHKEFGRKFEAIIPVYVINDPTYEANNGKFRALVFNDKKFYDELRKKIREQSLTASCFNAGKCVDFYIHMTEKEEVCNEGQANEYRYKTKVFDKWGFTKAENAHEIAAITPEKCDDMGFDDEYYVSSTEEELNAFYAKYIKVSNDDIPEDDVQVYDAPKAEAPVKKTNVVTETKMENKEAPAPANDDIPDDELNDLASDTDDLPVADPAPASTAAKPTNDVSDDEINALIDGI